MSYILDALKKVESEKKKKNRSTGMVNLSGELFRDELKQTSAWSAGRIAAVMFAVCLATFAGTFFLFRGDKQRAVTDAVKPASMPVQPAVMPAQTAAFPAPNPPPAAPVVAKHDVAPAAKSIEPKHSKLLHNAEQPKVMAKPRVSQVAVPVVAIPPPAEIKVSGIAWQDDRGARRSVVNGSLLQEGSVVAGARITEILPDRVRFSQAGKTFEITLLAAGSGPGK